MRIKNVLYTIIIIMIIGLIFGCKKKEDPDPQPAEVVCYPTKYIGDNVVRVEYNADNSIKRLILNDSTFINPVYDGEKRVVSVTENSNPTPLITLSYFTDGRIQLDEPANTPLTRKIYHKTNGKITKIEYYNNNAGVYTLDSYNTLNYSGNNPSIITDFTAAGVETGSHTYTFDDKKHADEYYGMGLFYPNPFVNNITKEVSTTPGNPSLTITYTYEYNSNGYPTKRTYNSAGVTGTDTFEYNCK